MAIRFTPDQEQEMLADFRLHHSIKGMAKKFGISTHAATEFLTLKGLHRVHSKPTFSELQTRSIVTEYEEGASVNDLHKKYNRAYVTIKRLLVENGISLRGRAESVRLAAKKCGVQQIADEQIEGIERLYLEGKTEIETAKLLGISRYTVYLRLKKKGMLRPFVKATAEIVNEAIERCGDKRRFSVKAFADELGLDPSTVSRRMREEGVRLGRGGYLKLTMEQEDKICEMYPAWTLERLAEYFSISTHAVGGALRRNGIPAIYRCGRRSLYVDRRGRALFMASSYEKAFAKMLDGRNLDWEYEGRRFQLSGGRTYTPDFFIPAWQQFIELKGYLRTASADRIRDFRIEYPEHKLILLKRSQLETFYGLQFTVRGAATYAD